MQTSETYQIPQTVGSYISYDFYQNLVSGYAQQHPTEQKSVFVPRKLILNTLERFPNVSGLRFMYGQQEGAGSGSRTLLLMACDNDSVKRDIPNIILRPNGYLTDKGESNTLDQCWDLMTRYVDRICSLLPDQTRKTVPRGVFFGLNIMKHLLDAPGCAGIQFHFGYNADSAFLPDRYESVMEAVDSQHKSLNIFAENGSRCPTVCGGGIEENPIGWPFTDTYGGEQMPKGSLFEMFHYVSPPLFEAVQNKELYKEHFAECLTLVKNGKVSEAGLELKKQLDHMMEEYLFEH